MCIHTCFWHNIFFKTNIITVYYRSFSLFLSSLSPQGALLLITAPACNCPLCACAVNLQCWRICFAIKFLNVTQCNFDLVHELTCNSKVKKRQFCQNGWTQTHKLYKKKRVTERDSRYFPTWCFQEKQVNYAFKFAGSRWLCNSRDSSPLPPVEDAAERGEATLPAASDPHSPVAYRQRSSGGGGPSAGS